VPLEVVVPSAVTEGDSAGDVEFGECRAEHGWLKRHARVWDPGAPLCTDKRRSGPNAFVEFG
jgi:hypothetical protein